MEFAIQVEACEDSGFCILKIQGEVDLVNSPQMREEIKRVLLSGHCIIDCTEIDYMDSTAFHALLDCQKQAEDRGVRMILAGLKPSIYRILKVTRLLEVFCIFDTIEDAKESLAQAQ